MGPKSSDDPLGSLFSKLRGSIDDPETPPTPSPAQEPPPPPAPPSPPVDPAAVAPTVPVDPARAGDDLPDLDDEFVVVVVDLLELDPVEPEPTWPVFSVAESATLDDVALRRRRDASVGAAAAGVAPRVKRLLQDEQNELLDTVRRQRGKADAATALPDAVDQLAAWCDVLRPAVDDVYAAGRVLGGGRTRPAPTALVERLAERLVLPLRERVLASLESVLHDEPYDALPELQRAVAGAVGARYREWRGQELTDVLADLLTWAYARGIHDATPNGVVLRWVPAEVQQCPDADDNALEPTLKGRAFPTGQSCAPAHPGCRCLVVPVDA